MIAKKLYAYVIQIKTMALPPVVNKKLIIYKQVHHWYLYQHNIIKSEIIAYCLGFASGDF